LDNRLVPHILSLSSLFLEVSFLLLLGEMVFFNPQQLPKGKPLTSSLVFLAVCFLIGQAKTKPVLHSWSSTFLPAPRKDRLRKQHKSHLFYLMRFVILLSYLCLSFSVIFCLVRIPDNKGPATASGIQQNKKAERKKHKF
jgi:hypothetical protein